MKQSFDWRWWRGEILKSAKVSESYRLVIWWSYHRLAENAHNSSNCLVKRMLWTRSQSLRSLAFTHRHQKSNKSKLFYCLTFYSCTLGSKRFRTVPNASKRINAGLLLGCFSRSSVSFFSFSLSFCFLASISQLEHTIEPETQRTLLVCN